MPKEYIEREAFLERVDGIWDCADMVFEPNDKCCRSDDCASCKWRETKNAIRKIAAYLPAADVMPVRHGRWVVCEEYTSISKIRRRETHMITWMCSECFASNGRRRTRFCPNCGARMDGDGE